MHELRLNDITLQVKKQTVFLFDKFGDISENEIQVLIAYLVEEGFINPEKEVNVFVKAQTFIARPAKEISGKPKKKKH